MMEAVETVAAVGLMLVLLVLIGALLVILVFGAVEFISRMTRRGR